MRAFARALPQLAARVPVVPIGHWPTPIERIVVEGEPIWVKCEGDSHPRYGGNKLRTLEVWLGFARAQGAEKIWAVGAYGSNHAVATVLHARAAGMEAGAILFPQPVSAWAIENCVALATSGCELVRLRSVIEVPFAHLIVGRRDPRAVVMPPGGATTVGTFGAMAAAFELAEQIANRDLPPPTRIVLAVGSTCTAAGLLAGVALAQAAGAWPWRVPIIHGVRVTPWPVTSRVRIAHLAGKTLARAAALGGPRVTLGLRELIARLVIDGRELGPGYGRPTPQAVRAEAELATAAPALRLDGVYSAKAAAALLRLHRANTESLLFWASKSTTRLPIADVLRGLPRALFDWVTSDPGALAKARVASRTFAT